LDRVGAAMDMNIERALVIVILVVLIVWLISELNI
jgi:hypothetical protein